MILETERLILRQMTLQDFDALYKVLGDKNIMGHYPYAFDEGKVTEWINRNIERYKTFGFGLWAVCLKETGEMIGDCGLTMQIIHNVIRPEIGYHIRSDKQRQGYAKEAAVAVRDWTFRNTTYNEIYSYMKYTNEPSARSAMSWGCRKVDEYEDDVNEITHVYRITRKEWGDMLDIVKLQDKPELLDTAARWFHEKWGYPEEIYREYMERSLNNAVSAWYLCMDGEKIVAGAGVIENDFHPRKDLTPNVCGVYTEESYRKMGLVGRILNFICEDMKNNGIDTLYLLTDHDSFYERYGWDYFCDVTGDGEEKPSRMYIHKMS